MTELIASSLRLKALRATKLLDTPAEESFDRLTRLAVRVLKVPIALVSLVDEDRQFFKSCVGLPEPISSQRQTPLSYSLCKHAVMSGEPLIVSDVREHPDLKDNPVIGMGAIAYAGIPITDEDGFTLGSFCVIDIKPRMWTIEEIEVLGDLAESVMVEIRLKGAKNAAEKANRAKDLFLAMLSHELRTPLSPALLVASAMAEDQSLPASVRDDAKMVQRNIEQQTRLVDDLLDITRIENGKLTLKLEPVNLHEVIEESLAMCANTAAERQVKIQLDLQAGKCNINADRCRLRQICSNLLSNAIKFTPPEGTVTIRTADARGTEVILSVIDTGIGMDGGELTRIFSPFEQVGGYASKGYSGLGLGLAISKSLAETQGGRIWAASEGAGKGSTLTVAFPITADIPRHEVVGKQSQRLPGAPLSILLVDDHEDTLAALSRLLRRLKYRVTTAGSITSALRAAEREQIDLLISDIGLPDGSGNELMRQLLARQPVKGIAVTGYGSEVDIEQTQAAGFAAHITKPIRFEALEQIIVQLEAS